MEQVAPNDTRVRSDVPRVGQICVDRTDVESDTRASRLTTLPFASYLSLIAAYPCLPGQSIFPSTCLPSAPDRRADRPVMAIVDAGLPIRVLEIMTFQCLRRRMCGYGRQPQ